MSVYMVGRLKSLWEIRESGPNSKKMYLYRVGGKNNETKINTGGL